MFVLMCVFLIVSVHIECMCACVCAYVCAHCAHLFVNVGSCDGYMYMLLCAHSMHLYMYVRMYMDKQAITSAISTCAHSYN